MAETAQTPGALESVAPLRHLRLRRGGISYRAAGDPAAPALVLLHGVGSGSASWAAQLADLSPYYHVIAWDAPGYGGSEPLREASPRAADYAAALGEFVTALGLGRFHLLGHSLGAVMAAAFCRGAEKARVLRLILASPAAGYGRAEEALRKAKIDGRLADMARLGPDGLAAARAPALLSARASAAAVERVCAAIRGLHPEGYAQAVRMLGQADILADVAAIAAPALVLCGSADGVTPEAGCRRIADALPGAIYRQLPGLGHAAYIEDPAGFDRALLDFIEKESSP